MSVPNPREVITTKALTVWVAAMLVYIMAITGRTSFGVAGLEAIDRFQVDASRIAVFTTVQVGIYALAQIPTGILIDKYGPRKLLVIGAVIMGLGQTLLGVTSNYWVAIGARLLIGAGDATAFLSVMRILPYWFPLHRTPMFTQVTSSLGQLGQFISAVPFSLFLGWAGWTTAFVSLGAVGILIALAAAVAVADSPESAGILDAPKEQPNSQTQTVRARLRHVLRSPVAWQAFFIHYIGMITANVFALLWGIPMMTQGLGVPKTQAGWVLTWLSVCVVLAGPLHGNISSRARGYRPWLAIALTLAHMSAWALFFAFGGSYLSLFILMVAVALCSPAANYGFDIVRENMDRSVVATATGLGNMGGFTATMLGAQLFGMSLSRVGEHPHYTIADFRTAAVAVALVWAVGIIGVVATHLARKRQGGDEGPRVTIVDVG
ncbi:nitrate/nitrite transporter [Corynebacterium sp.]|uniref:MFS transporter n=1 Tax=Corynebacterium sp. TaxID=1720 RepID=UPI0026DB2A68|nr:MFS transporter [Corynebacterium sp.]MDO5031329.1 MFS transporter [Corynebacterium sp.]